LENNIAMRVPTKFAHKKHIVDTVSAFFAICKRHWIAMSFLLGFLFVSALLGHMVGIIGNKDIVEPIAIDITAVDGESLATAQTYMQLARAGNYSYIRPIHESQSSWYIEKVFVKDLFVGASQDQLANMNSVTIGLGDTFYEFDPDAVLQWEVFDTSHIRSEMLLTEDEYKSFVLYRVPSTISLQRSQIPVYAHFFSSILNWKGDSVIVYGTIMQAVATTAHVVLWLIVISLLCVYFFHTNLFDKQKRTIVNRQILIAVATIVTTLGSIVVISLCIHMLYKPDIALLLQEASDHFIRYFYKHIRPKPVERLQFMMSTVLSPFVIMGLYILYSSLFHKKNVLAYVQKFHAAILVAFVGIVFFWMYVGLSLSGFLFIQDSIIYQPIAGYVYTLLVFPFVAYLFFKKSMLQKYHTYIYYAANICIIIFVLFIGAMHLGNPASLYNSLTIDPVLYPVSQVVMGKQLLVNFDSYYGLYAFFLAPLFHIVPLTISSFTSLMAMLMILSVSALFFAMRHMISHVVLRYAGFVTVIFYTLLATRVTQDYYYQYWPIRYIFPCMMLYIVARYIKHREKWVYYVAHIWSAIAVLWNLDVGIVLWIAWLAMLIYTELCNGSVYKNILKQALAHVGYGICSLFLVVFVFSGITYIQSGVLPEFARIVQYQKIFLSGYLMIKMLPPPHMWSIVVLIYIIGLYISARQLWYKKTSYIPSYVFFLTVLGLGLFAYYEGQSSDVTLFRVSYPALFLCVLYADMLWKRIASKKYTWMELGVFVGMMYILLSTPFSVMWNMSSYRMFLQQAMMVFQRTEHVFYDNVDFINDYVEQGDPIVVLSYPNQGMYYAQSGTYSAVDVTAIADIPFPEEMERLINFLQTNTSTPLFVEGSLDIFDDFDERIQKTIVQRYDVLDVSDGGMMLYKLKEY